MEEREREQPLANDRELLVAFREGRRPALERVYRRFAPEVARFLRSGFMYKREGKPVRFRGIQSPFDLEGAVQEVFARAFEPRARAAYDGLRPYGGFLVGIARNVVLDDLRRRARRGESIEPVEVVERRAAAGAPGAETTPEPEISLDELRGRKLVQAFLEGECDKRDLELYELRYRRELSQAAAAKEAGLTRIQVRRWEVGFRGRLLRFLKRADYVREP